jgi:hypothetical protein
LSEIFGVTEFKLSSLWLTFSNGSFSSESYDTVMDVSPWATRADPLYLAFFRSRVASNASFSPATRTLPAAPTLVNLSSVLPDTDTARSDVLDTHVQSVLSTLLATL